MNALTVPEPRKLWVRLLFMVLLAAAFQLAASVLFFVAVLQLLLAVATGAPNARLRIFGRSLGRYLAQIADFESFGNETLPFPFSEWPEDVS
ncbi:MAG: lipase [Burkholderiales bacterium RIFCSPHIGHO2_12_FULL_61_11]|nr:MAG: lipase [Burkholderiales bacterium RIFCSPHIGHO2_12_FULL_61_11]